MKCPEDTLEYLLEKDRDRVQNVAELARAKVLARHTPMHRAEELKTLIEELMD